MFVQEPVPLVQTRKAVTAVPSAAISTPVPINANLAINPANPARRDPPSVLTATQVPGWSAPHAWPVAQTVRSVLAMLTARSAIRATILMQDPARHAAKTARNVTVLQSVQNVRRDWSQSMENVSSAWWDVTNAALLISPSAPSASMNTTLMAASA